MLLALKLFSFEMITCTKTIELNSSKIEINNKLLIGMIILKNIRLEVFHKMAPHVIFRYLISSSYIICRIYLQKEDLSLANGLIILNIPFLVRSLKSSNVEPG